MKKTQYVCVINYQLCIFFPEKAAFLQQMIILILTQQPQGPQYHCKARFAFGNHLNYPGIIIVRDSFRLLAFIVSLHVPCECRGQLGKGLLTSNSTNNNSKLLKAIFFTLYSFHIFNFHADALILVVICLLYTSPSPRDQRGSRMPSSA